MDRILSTWQKTYAFHANVAGTIGLGSGRPTVLDTLPNKFTSTNLKVVLVMGMIILLGALLFRACIDNWLKMQFSL
jgi:hypothetical protein